MAYAKDAPMPRLTARLLLLIVALGIFQPLLEAFSAKPPHACCLRRLHARKDQPLQFRDATKLNGNCCPPLTAPRSANVVSCGAVYAVSARSIINLPTDADVHFGGPSGTLLARAPPSRFSSAKS
ncbi:MAG: hypothetical protein DMG97_18920 [Acidobacteria bacterium]|nr:MAG: hypothetical protein DMG98_02475 [Acidobacteriota bacterium]PYV70289.1 MAG: hypothetical protein DMG96_31630 [Acidobacteriota bacterium]PYV70579.1 MAG: hypothetical protein DMG97_18920 [Acidobacteriota bacterium]